MIGGRSDVRKWCSLADIERPNLTVHRLTPGSDVGVLVPQEVYSRGGGYCDGGGDI